MNLVLLLLFSWIIFFLIFHRYHSGMYLTKEEFQSNGNNNAGQVTTNVVENSENANANANANVNANENVDELELSILDEEVEEVNDENLDLSEDPNVNVNRMSSANIRSRDIREREPDVKNCLFVPRGHSVQSCIDRCHNREDRKYWGGNNCTNKNCTTICTGCKNKDLCDWITSENIYKDVSIPNPPPKQEITALAGDSKAVVMWKSVENQGQTNRAFIIKYFKTYKPFEGVRIANIVIEDSKKKNYSYNLENLENNEFYSVGIMAVNDTDVGPMSNIEQITPKENREILTN